MTFTRLLLLNLLHHRRGNVAILLGVVVGTTVLTGALLVGDSLRGSLRELSEKQLGWIDVALVGQRFFREELTPKLPAKHISPVLMLQTAATGRPDAGAVPKSVLLGVGPAFWIGMDTQGKDGAAALAGMPVEFWAQRDTLDRNQAGVVLSAVLARDLNAAVGDNITFALEWVSGPPRETVLGQRDTEDVIRTVILPVKAILPTEHFGSTFNLSPSPILPRNAFVPLAVLQEELFEQQRQKKTHKRFPRRAINTVLVRGGDPSELQAHLKKEIQLIDWGLDLRVPVKKFKIPAPKYLSLESREMFIPPVVQQAVNQAGLRSAPTLVYLVNNLSARKQQWGALALTLVPPGGAELLRPMLREYVPVQSPYVLAAALDPGLEPPLGPFLPKGVSKLADDEIVLAQWQGSPFGNLRPREDYLHLTYFDPNLEGQLREVTSVFRYAGSLPITGAANDQYLTPEFPGVTDASSLTQLDGWDPPFPFKRWLISKEVDEQYWTDHRSTPKAYITLTAGQKLWGTRFGDVTSVRIDPQGKKSAEIARLILEHLDPDQGGFRFENVRSDTLNASAGSQEFGGLFLGFSFFLIVSALLLIGLLFRLNLDPRAGEIGLLLAVGYRRRTVCLLLLVEGLILSLVGGIVGSLVAVGYAQLLLDYLAASWPGGLDRALFLHLHVTPLSLLIGYGAAVLASVLTIFWATRVLGRVSPRALLAGATAETQTEAGPRSRWLSKSLVTLGVMGAAACFIVGVRVHDHEIQALSFLGSGALLLTTGLAGLWLWLHTRERTLESVQVTGAAHEVSRAPAPLTSCAAPQLGAPTMRGGVARLGVRNAARHPVRSLLTTGLLASATFLIVAVQAFHRDPAQGFLDKEGGSGGFALIGETQVPVFEDLNKKSIPNAPVEFCPFRVQQGDDASCLNLYKPREPRLLGVPSSIIQRGGFHFTDSAANTPEEKENPWLLLNKPQEGGTIPVFGEANTVTWMLGSKLGGEVTVQGSAGQPVTLRIVGLLKDSVFQSELLMSDENFRRLYPRNEGFKLFLIEIPEGRQVKVDGTNKKLSEEKAAAAIKKSLEKNLSDYGMVVTSSRARLETFLAVENTYLATFQALGGLGLVLGALGLAVVLLRGVWERRGELALLRALGFRRSALGWLVLAENCFLLVMGLLIGVGAALLSVAPHIIGGSEVRWLALAGLLVCVLLVGLLAGLFAVMATLRAPLILALRKE